MKIQRPCAEIVRLYNDKWNEKEEYVNVDGTLFNMAKTLPSNSDFNSVYVKICAVNSADSCQIYNKDIFSIAKRITKIPYIDDRINSGDLSVVKDIADCGNRGKLYSFATKYCCVHNSEKFPKKDYLVVNLLYKFNKKYTFTEKILTKTALNDYLKYEFYVSVINDFKKFFGLDEFSYKEIDQYLWQLGKYN